MANEKLDNIDRELASTAEIEEEQNTIDQNSQGKRFGRVTDGAFFADSYNARLNGLLDTAANHESQNTKQTEDVYINLEKSINNLIDNFNKLKNNYITGN